MSAQPSSWAVVAALCAALTSGACLEPKRLDGRALPAPVTADAAIPTELPDSAELADVALAQDVVIQEAGPQDLSPSRDAPERDRPIDATMDRADAPEGDRPVDATMGPADAPPKGDRPV